MDFTEAWDDTCSYIGLAARIGNITEFRKLVEAGNPVDAPDNRGWRPLHEAAAEPKDLRCLEELLKHKDTDVNWQTHEGETALLLACKRRCRTNKKPLEAVKLLLKYKADPNIADNEEETPLLAATRSGFAPVVLELLNNGKADPNKVDCSGWGSLHEAAMLGRADIVISLLTAGAKISIQDECEMTPIFTAAQHGKIECLKILLDAAKERGEVELIDMRAEDGATPVMIAAQQGFTECVEMLLAYGANINLKSFDNITALHLAVQGEHVSCLKLLMDHANVNELIIDYQPEKFRNRISRGELEPITPLHLAVEWNSNRCLKLLLERGFPVDCLCERGTRYEPQFFTFLRPTYETALSYAIGKENVEAVDILLEAGANCNSTSDDVLHPLIPALVKSSFLLIDKLIDHGSDVNYKRTCVPFAEILLIALKNKKLFLHLLFHGADPRLLFPTGNVPFIHYSVNLLFAFGYSWNQTLHILYILLLFNGMTKEFRECVDILQESRIKFNDYDALSWETFLKEIEKPSTLSVFCRICIRRHLVKIHRGRNALNNAIYRLQLPRTLITYLLYEDAYSKFWMDHGN
ncbi:ankyrin repeat and SOCS box protein 3-like [Centruroides vittatus]|uniref:ankyrin repeat and SOCS box protein 3-like n=1 Tax=Centruroides vittatus TaxID=120091 RepID=UPI00350EC7AC